MSFFPFSLLDEFLTIPGRRNAWSQIRINSEEKGTSIRKRKCVSIFNSVNSLTPAGNIHILAMASVHLSKSLICFVAVLLFIHKQVRKNHAMCKAFPCTLNFRLSGKIQWVWPSFSFADCKWIGIFSNLLNDPYLMGGARYIMNKACAVTNATHSSEFV